MAVEERARQAGLGHHRVDRRSRKRVVASSRAGGLDDAAAGLARGGCAAAVVTHELTRCRNLGTLARTSANPLPGAPRHEAHRLHHHRRSARATRCSPSSTCWATTSSSPTTSSSTGRSPARRPGVGARARMRTNLPGPADWADMEVDRDASRRSGSSSAPSAPGGKRVSRGTYSLEPEGDGATRVRFELVIERLPPRRACSPRWPAHGCGARNDKAMRRLTELLETCRPPSAGRRLSPRVRRPRADRRDQRRRRRRARARRAAGDLRPASRRAGPRSASSR